MGGERERETARERKRERIVRWETITEKEDRRKGEEKEVHNA